VDAQKLVIDQRREGEVVEEVHDQVVHLLVVLGEACIRGRVHSTRKLKKEVSWRHSWFPRRRKKVFLNLILRERMRAST
jgi:hypothetical protein